MIDAEFQGAQDRGLQIPLVLLIHAFRCDVVPRLLVAHPATGEDGHFEVGATKAAILHHGVYRWLFDGGATKIVLVRLLLLSLILVAVAGIVLLWRASTSMSNPSNTPEPAQVLSPAKELDTTSTDHAAEPMVEPLAAPEAPLLDAKERVALARTRHGESIKRQCAEADLGYPPKQLFLRAFKEEGEIEAWGSNGSGPMKLIKTWPLTARSGVPGPKRREGDRQIPEGCYQIVIFNPQSSFHLSMGLDYPNAADRVHSDPEKPGLDIYIHGNDRSIGCLAIGDDMIEELYLLAADFRDTCSDAIPVHIFPTRMKGDEWNGLRLRYPQHADFWGELEPIYKAFEDSRRVPQVKVDAAGSYAIEG